MYACFVYTYVIKKEKEPREEGKEKKRRISKRGFFSLTTASRRFT